MPLVKSNYRSWVKNGHLQTILPNLFRKIKFIEPRVEIIDTPDDDFLELEWYENKNTDKLLVLTHGLEGNAKRTYMLGMAKYFFNKGYSVLCWNFRSCGTTMNRQLRFYHTGDTTDITTVLNHCFTNYNYSKIALVGFSMGGNVSLKYLGELGEVVNNKIKTVCAISAPVHLESSSRRMMKFENKIYMKRFIRFLRKKIEIKSKSFPDKLSLEGYENVKNFKHFDDKYTSPIHGFINAEDYWTQASSLPLLHRISIPSLLINAENDSFLGKECFPIEIAEKSSLFHLEIPKSGGHVGFWTLEEFNWAEKRAFEFVDSYMNL